MKAETGFAVYDKALFADVKKTIKGLRDGYKDIAYALYVYEMKINNTLLSEAQKAQHKDILFKRVNGKYNPVMQSYLNKIKLSLNYKMNPGGTINTDWVIKNAIRIAKGQKNQKIQYSVKINDINRMPDEIRDTTDYSAIDEHTRSLEDND